MNRTCHHAVAVLATFLIGASTANVHAATFSDDNWTGMAGYAGANGPVRAAVVDGAGHLYIAGEFNTVGSVPANRIAKWNGTNWSALGTELLRYDFDGPDVYALAASGTDLYVGGWFATEEGNLNIVKWDGTNWSGLGSGVNGGVGGLTVANAELIAAGSFTIAGAKISPNLARARIGRSVKSVAATNSTASIQLSGVTGYQYDVQRTTNLTSPITWTTLTTSPLSPAAGGSFTFTDTNAPPGKSFYRARELP